MKTGGVRMKVLKSFIHKQYGATEGDEITIQDKKVTDILVKKGILKEDEKSAVNVKTDKN